MRGQIERARMMFASVQTKRASALMLIAGVSMTGCASTGGSETERAICRELRLSLPTWSSADTVQSRTEAAEFLDVFEAVCGGLND